MGVIELFWEQAAIGEAAGEHILIAQARPAICLPFWPVGHAYLACPAGGRPPGTPALILHPALGRVYFGLYSAVFSPSFWHPLVVAAEANSFCMLGRGHWAAVYAALLPSAFIFVPGRVLALSAALSAINRPSTPFPLSFAAQAYYEISKLMETAGSWADWFGPAKVCRSYPSPHHAPSHLAPI